MIPLFPFYTSIRNLFISTQTTPNPQALKFTVDQQLFEQGSATYHYGSILDTTNSPLAQMIFQTPGVDAVFLGNDFVTITLSPEENWAVLKNQLFGTITDFFSSGKPAVNEDAKPPEDTAPQEGDSIALLKIKELLETRIRGDIQDDGGDIELVGFEEATGVVYLKMKGSCSNCPSSSSTLKHGIQNMLTYYVSEVTAVEPVEDPIDAHGQAVFDQLMERINAEKKKRIENLPLIEKAIEEEKAKNKNIKSSLETLTEQGL